MLWMGLRIASESSQKLHWFLQDLPEFGKSGIHTQMSSQQKTLAPITSCAEASEMFPRSTAALRQRSAWMHYGMVKKWRRVANKCHEANASLFLTFVNALAGVLHSVPFWSADAIFWHKEVYTRWNGSECETFSKTNLNFCCFLTHRTSNTNLVSDACSFPSTGPDQCLHLIMLSSSAPDHTC